MSCDIYIYDEVNCRSDTYFKSLHDACILDTI